MCSLKLGSWAYNGFQVNVFKRTNTIDLSNYVDNGEWKLIGIKVKVSCRLYLKNHTTLDLVEFDKRDRISFSDGNFVFCYIFVFVVVVGLIA